MTATYDGPLREEPLAIELHNTLYAAGGELVDGLQSLDAFADAIAPRLPAGAVLCAADHDALVDLRAHVRAALHATLDDAPMPRAALDAINAAAARAPSSPRARLEPDGTLTPTLDRHGARPADLALAAIAADAIDLLTGPRRDALRACGAPGCVLVHLARDPRRQWCSNACGNRARQARHYARSRRMSP